ncbi:hypothetical protein HAX54_011585 [Datura stramonium]|uniref:Uncharacterized protein n=1 Tax=Datura stramonium TaxID=4076 RepID=A0ABS8Y4X9_DATST|nr:hypothetical protein [Datura stramonium]
MREVGRLLGRRWLVGCCSGEGEKEVTNVLLFAVLWDCGCWVFSGEGKAEGGRVAWFTGEDVGLGDFSDLAVRGKRGRMRRLKFAGGGERRKTRGSAAGRRWWCVLVSGR